MHFDTTNIPADIIELWTDADEKWELKQAEPAYESYASANYTDVYNALKSLVGQADSFVEFGSGLGIVTLMASQLGFSAYGIEAKQPLVESAEEYAVTYAPNAIFAVGSFIPDEFEWEPAAGDESVRTFVDVPSAYHELDMDLSDFDLIYAYPWPTEHRLYDRIVDQFGRKGAIFLTYDAREGIHIRRVD